MSSYTNRGRRARRNRTVQTERATRPAPLAAHWVPVNDGLCMVWSCELAVRRTSCERAA